MRVLVCGDRNWSDRAMIDICLDQIKGALAYTDDPGYCPPAALEIISGMARGADTLAAEWAEANAVPCHRFYARWKELGKKAGVLRNQQMLDEGNPELVLAFHDDLDASKGTADMVKRAQRARVPVRVLRHVS